MTDREKLIEVLGEFLLWPSKMKHVWMPQGIEKLADHLIANGVTVQKWIPVTERLPEKNKMVLVYLDGDFALSEYYDDDIDGRAMWSYTGLGGYHTHWMPLPEPPKEGE